MQRTKELLAAAKGAASDLWASEKGKRKSAEQQKALERSSKKQKKTATQNELQVPFLERAFASAAVLDAPSVHYRDHGGLAGKPVGFKSPFVVRDVPWSKEVHKTISPYKADYDDFKAVFAASRSRRSTGHASRVLKDRWPLLENIQL